MSDPIFYAIGKNQHGPASIAHLRALVAKGEFRRTDRVWREGMPDWSQALAIPEIFAGMPPDLNVNPSPAQAHPFLAESRETSVPQPNASQVPFEQSHKKRKQSGNKQEAAVRIEQQGFETATLDENVQDQEAAKKADPRAALLREIERDIQTVRKSGSSWVHDINKVYKERIKQWREAAEADSTEAQWLLGVCHAEGFGGTKSDEEAAKLFHHAAAAGMPEAQCWLADFYGEGRGVPIDPNMAVQWYRKAAEQGLAEAQCSLGNCYADGAGMAKDDAEAVRWYRKAAKQGNAEAQCSLGVCYENGRGVFNSEVNAAKWYRKAAEQGEAAAQVNLGRCYANRIGVEGNVSEAYKWANLSAAQGFAGADDLLRVLEARMSPEQIAEGQRLSREFKPPQPTTMSPEETAEGAPLQTATTNPENQFFRDLRAIFGWAKRWLSGSRGEKQPGEGRGEARPQRHASTADSPPGGGPRKRGPESVGTRPVHASTMLKWVEDRWKGFLASGIALLILLIIVFVGMYVVIHDAVRDRQNNERGNPSAFSGQSGTAAAIPTSSLTVEDGKILDAIRLYFGRWSNAKSRDAEKRTPLHIAANLGNPRLVAHLLSEGADVNAVDQDHSTPLLLHVLPNTSTLLGDDWRPYVKTWWGASRPPEPTIEQKLARLGVQNPASSSVTATLKLLIQAGADVRATNHTGDTLLHILPGLRSEANLDARDMQEIVVLALERGADTRAPNASGDTPLHLFAAALTPDVNGVDLDLFALLTREGADVNATDAAGDTPLHFAGASCVETLLGLGADPTRRDRRGRLPVDAATEAGDDLKVLALRKHGSSAATLVNYGRIREDALKWGRKNGQLASAFHQAIPIRNALQVEAHAIATGSYAFGNASATSEDQEYKKVVWKNQQALETFLTAYMTGYEEGYKQAEQNREKSREKAF